MLEIVPFSEEKYQNLKSETEKDTQLQVLSKQVRKGWPDTKAECSPDLHPFWNIRDLITEADGIMYKSDKIIIPKSMQKEMMDVIHKAHMGMQKCKSRARLCVYWPNMNSQIENVVSSCSICQEFRSRNRAEPLKSHEIPNRPWGKVGCDLFQYKGRDYIVCVDYYSKFPEVQLISDKTAKQCISALKSIFARHGIPETVVSDNGPCFASHEFRVFSKEWGFKLNTSSPLHSQSNGQAENCVKTVKNLFKKAEKANSDPLIALLEYRVTPIDGIEASPSQLLYSRELRAFLPTTANRLKPRVVSNAHVQLKTRQARQKYFHDRKYNRNLKQLSEGEVVRMSINNKWQPAVVEGKFDESLRSYIVRSPAGDRYRRNRKHLIPKKEAEMEECPQIDVPITSSSVPIINSSVPIVNSSVPIINSSVPETVPNITRAVTRSRTGTETSRPKRFQD